MLVMCKKWTVNNESEYFDTTEIIDFLLYRDSEGIHTVSK